MSHNNENESVSSASSSSPGGRREKVSPVSSPETSPKTRKTRVSPTEYKPYRPAPQYKPYRPAPQGQAAPREQKKAWNSTASSPPREPYRTAPRSQVAPKEQKKAWNSSSSRVVRTPTPPRKPVRRANDSPGSSKSSVDMKKALAAKVGGTKTTVDNYEEDDSFDAPLGSYNQGDSQEEWAECLDFFCLDARTYIGRTEGFGGAAPVVSGDRKRAGMKKLYGMTVSLFDYQLMGVFRLMKQLTKDCPGGFLADGCGIGKTLEMLGVLSTAKALRAMMAEIKAEPSGKKSLFSKRRHLAPNATKNAKCPSEKKYGVRCPCHCNLSRKLVAMLPEGPNFLLTPAKTVSQFYQEAKQKLDKTIFQVVKLQEEDTLPARDSLVIVGSYPHLNYPSFDTLRSLVPGIIFMDEFHEVAHPCPRVIHPGLDVMAWVNKVVRSHKARPVVYFTSATPIENSPGDLAQALSVLERRSWSDSSHPMAIATTEQLELVDSQFRNLKDCQTKGREVRRDDVQAYRARLDDLLNAIMIRRLASDSFRGRPITDLGPMSVTIQQCPLPRTYKADIQALALLAMREADKATANTDDLSVSGLFTTGRAARMPAIEALRIAATFPATAPTLRLDPEQLSDETIWKTLHAAKGDLRNSPFWEPILTWTRESPKMTAVLKMVNTMAHDISPIEGESTRAKKLCIFTPTEAEAMLIYGFLLHARGNTYSPLRPVWLHPAALPPSKDASLEDNVVKPFQTYGNHAPNILVASMAYAGTGLNFPQAKYCVVTGPGFRKSDTTQVFGRCHRIRQKQRTQLLLLVSRGNPLDRRLYDAQRGLVVPEETAWTVAAEGDEEIPEYSRPTSTSSSGSDIRAFVSGTNVDVMY